MPVEIGRPPGRARGPAGAGGNRHPTASYRPADPAAPLCLPGRNRVRIDLETGVCVASQSLEAATPDYGHWIRIIAVDEYMLDDLFLAESMNLTDVRRHISWDIRA